MLGQLYTLLTDNPAAVMLGGLILLLTGLQHLINPGSSLVVELFQLVQISGAGIELLARIAGIAVAGIGLGLLGIDY
jgi:hypothetical protein